MRIVVIGANGTVGSAVVEALAPRHEVVRVARSHGELQADITTQGSLRRLFESVGRFDAVVCAAGEAAYKPLAELADEDFRFSLESKLMGQVNVVREGSGRIADGGSFTLTSGILSTEPEPGGAAFSIVNAGVEAFARAAALELPRGLRVNVVSPPWVGETLRAMGMDPAAGMPAAEVAAVYVAAVEGDMTGRVIDARRPG